MSTYLLVHRQPHDCTGTPEAAAWEGGFGELGDALAGKGNAVLSDRGVVAETGRMLPLGPHTRQTIQPDPRYRALTPAMLAAAARARQESP